MASNNRWIFTDLELNNTPTRKCGLDGEAESTYRYQAGTLIRDIGHKLQVTQLCINTAIVYMHRFYMYHSFTNTSYKRVAPACIFLAAKVEEQPRKLEHVIRMTYTCLNRDPPNFDTKSETYSTLSQEINTCETTLLMTLGFDTTVEHPHTIIVRTCSMIKASKDFAQSAYFLATSSLLMTTMCLRYPTSLVACVCIHVACRWSSFEIPQSTEGKAWFTYIDPAVSPESLEEMTKQFCAALDKFPNKFKKKIANNRITAEDMGQQEKKLNFELPALVPALESKSKPAPTATVTTAAAAAAHGLPGRTLMPVWNSLKPQADPAATSSMATKPVEQLVVKSEKEAVPGTLSVSTGDPAMRRVKTEVTLSLTTKDYMERRRLEQRRLEDERQKTQPNVEKREPNVPVVAGIKQEKEPSLPEETTAVPDGNKVNQRENFLCKIKKEPKAEKKPEIPSSEINSKSQKLVGAAPDGLEIDLKPEHIYGNVRLPASALLHKPPPAVQTQAASTEQNHRHGNALGSRLSMPPFATGQGGKDGHEHHRSKDRLPRDPFAMGDISSHKEPTMNFVNSTNVGDRKSLELTSTSAKSDLDSLISVGGGGGGSLKKHKKERSHHHRSREEKERLREERPSTHNAPDHVNAPLKLKIPIASTSLSDSPSKRRSDPGELKLKIKSPAVASQSRPPETESTDGFKLKISLKGQLGKVEAVAAAGSRHSSASDGSVPQTVAPRNNGGSTSSHGVKLVLSKDKISGEYQHGVSSHHEERHRHRQHRHHSKATGAEHGGDSAQKRTASPTPLDSQKHKMPRLNSEVDRGQGNGNNGSTGYGNSNVYSGSYSQHPSYPTGVQQFSQQMVSASYPMQSVPGLGQLPPPPPPLPKEPSPPPPPPPLPPC